MTKIFFSLFIILSLVHLGTSCIHDKLNHPLEMDPPSASDDRVLAASDRQNMRIHATYYVGNAPAAIKKVIQQQLMPAAIAYYQAALKVTQLTTPITLTDAQANRCAEVSSTEALKNGVDADLVLLITGLDEPKEGYIAYATACVQDSTGRPKVGMINFNYAYGFDKSSYYYYQAQMYTTLHELGHVLGFSSNLYKYFLNPATGKPFTSEPTITKTVNGVDTVILTIEPLRTKLRTYFDCPSLEGAYIENQGGAGSKGSHFERRIFYNEFMTASDIADPRISEFFLALLEGTGWYTPDYALAEPMLWGKGQKCPFLESKCLGTNKQTDFPDYFCNTLAVDSCSFGAQSYGVCGTRTPSKKDSSLDPAFNYWGDNTVVLDSFADNCPFYQFIPTSECRDTSNEAINFPTGEFFGEASSCFTGTLGVQSALASASPLCLKKTCQQVSNNKYNVLIEINGQTVTCTQKATVQVTGYKGTLNCPDPNTFCTTSGLAYCPRGCSGRGTCTNNVCVCPEGFYGSDCSYRKVADDEPESDSGPNKAAIGAGAGVGGGILIVIIGFIIAKVKAWQAGGAAGAAAAGGDAKVVGDAQGIKTTTHYQNQPGQNDGPVELNMEGI